MGGFPSGMHSLNGTLCQVTRAFFPINGQSASNRISGRLQTTHLPGIPDLGYMESYMDWKLIFRTRQEMVGVSAAIPQAQIRDVRIFAEGNQNIIFLQITKQ
jgi:hypothetical protein